MKKRIFTIALIAALAAILVVGGTMAFFTDTKTKDNTFTIGNVSIDLDEPNWDPDDTDNKYPGEVIAKDPQVKNTGANDAFVRIKVEGLDSLKNAGLSSNDIELLNMSDKWVEKDGYYYYTVKLAAGETTPALFDSIKIPVDTTGDASHMTIDVKVTSEAVQADGIGIADPTVDQIADWFATCMPTV